MTHTDPDVLALLALGEAAATQRDIEHLAACPECDTRRARLLAAANAGRSASGAGGLTQPSERVWANISATLGFGSDAAPSAPASPREHTAAAGSEPSATEPSAVGAPSAAGASGSAGASDAPVRPIRAAASVTPVPPPAPDSGAAGSGGAATDVPTDRRVPHPWLARPWSAWAVAAASLVLLGGIAVSVVFLGTRDDARSPGEVVAEATLDELPAWPDASGSAIVTQFEEDRTIEVSVSADIRPNTLREVWLISEDLTKLVSLGLLAGDDGVFALPESIDLAEYTVVDVSSEPLDGDPAHSSDSIVRGSFAS